MFFYHSHAHPSILARAQDCPFNPGVGTGLPEKPITGPSPKVCQRCRPCSIADGVFFFTIHTPSRQSWRGHRIATLNPGVGTGLPHSISWRGHRIATLNPGVGTGLPRCFPENAGSAVLYSTTPPDSPPGLRGKHRQCVGTQRCTPGLAARIARKKLRQRPAV